MAEMVADGRWLAVISFDADANAAVLVVDLQDIVYRRMPNR